MQEYKRIDISVDEIIPVASRMRSNGVPLTMIHGHVDDAGRKVLSYEYEIGSGIESYRVEGVETVPSISKIYDLGAEWPEREITELIGVQFEGLDVTRRLFLPEDMIDGRGHILVTPMEELNKEKQAKEGSV